MSKLFKIILTAPIRLPSIAGHDCRENDLIYCPPAAESDEKSTVLYFGGDIQDFPESMKTNVDNSNLLRWNLDNMATLMSVSFPRSHIIVVRPSRVSYKTFSCFDNFVIGSTIGVPEHRPMYFALHHLKKLLQNATEKIKLMSTAELDEIILQSTKRHKNNMDNTLLQVIYDFKKEIPYSSENINKSSDYWWRENLSLDTNRLTLIGFSKGCVVLNQMLHEFHYLKSKNPEDGISSFVSQISDMFWLDGGHGGNHSTWITAKDVIKTYSGLGINTHIHVTPYQVRDKKHPWKAEEEQCFYDELKKVDANVIRFLHFEEKRPSLWMHFDVLKFFKNTENSL